MVDDAKKELLKKVKALAERGVGGEKEGAQRKLEELMKKYNIEEEDISDDKPEEFKFKYKTLFEKRLLQQLFYKIVPDYRSKAFTYSWGKGSRSIFGIECTKAEGLQIQIEYEFYKELWKEEEEFLFDCFVQKHEIFSTEPAKGSAKQLSREDLMRMAMMMGAMQNRSMHTMIEGE